MICGGIYGAIALIIAMTTYGDSEVSAMIGLTGIILSVLYLLPGAVLCIPVGLREVGKGMLAASGIILIIGLSLCSGFPTR